MMRSSMIGSKPKAVDTGAADSRVRCSGETRNAVTGRARATRSSAAAWAILWPSLERPNPGNLPYRMPSGLNTSPWRMRCTWLATTSSVYGGVPLEFTERGELWRPSVHKSAGATTYPHIFRFGNSHVRSLRNVEPWPTRKKRVRLLRTSPTMTDRANGCAGSASERSLTTKCWRWCWDPVRQGGAFSRWHDRCCDGPAVSPASRRWTSPGWKTCQESGRRQPAGSWRSPRSGGGPERLRRGRGSSITKRSPTSSGRNSSTATASASSSSWPTGPRDRSNSCSCATAAWMRQPCSPPTYCRPCSPVAAGRSPSRTTIRQECSMRPWPTSCSHADSISLRRRSGIRFLGHILVAGDSWTALPSSWSRRYGVRRVGPRKR